MDGEWAGRTGVAGIRGSRTCDLFVQPFKSSVGKLHVWSAIGEGIRDICANIQLSILL